MFDVFYIGKKPGLFAHERAANDIQHARQQSRTRYCWIITYLADYSDWDFLWEPPPWQRDFVHVWPSQWHDFSGTYLVPCDGDDVQYHFHDRVIPNRSRPAEFEVLVPGVEFDFSWSPHPLDPPFTHVFGNQWWSATTWPTVIYQMPGAVTDKYYQTVRAQLPVNHDHWHCLHDCDFDRSWQPDPGDPPYIYVFGNQWWSAEKMPTVEYHVPGAVQRKFLVHPRALLRPDLTRWQIPSGIDHDSIDYSWVPDPGAPPYIYEFSTQHQKTGGPRYHVPGAKDVKYVDQIRVTVKASQAWVYVIDHLDGHLQDLREQLQHIEIKKVSRYVDSYLGTLQRIAASVPSDQEWIWIVSTVCDYAGFDFTWYPEQWQATMLHVFGSDDLKFGDTFFMHVPTFRERAAQVKLLEWYDVNFVDRSVPRRLIPVVHHSEDSQVSAIRDHQTRAPVTLFVTESVPDRVPAVNLWRSEVKAVIPLDTGACRVVVPREAIADVRTQVYDYAIIDRTHLTDNMCQSLDIVFISNGEPNADENWARLLLSKQGRSNRCVRVDGVNGRAAAYHAAAEASQTAWFFAVFAKLEVLADFDWSWQPDRLQQPKHYIFHARNPVNMLEYGHQAMIAYNRRLTLANPGRGLDFTLDDAHEVVPVLSGVARYNVDAWTAWRTAFREVLKLRASLPDVENEYRISRWCMPGSGVNCQWSSRGAQDALAYHDEVAGDFAALKKSYEWSWLASYAMMLHPELVTQSRT